MHMAINSRHDFRKYCFNGNADCIWDFQSLGMER